MSGTVLIVDDDSSIVTVVERILTKGGYAYHSFKDFRNAEDAIRGEGEFQGEQIHYDVAYVDRGGSTEPGMEVMQTSKKINPSVPVIAISGYSEAKTKPREADAFLQKPFTLEEFQRSLKERLR
jgi:DNA-binding NtrC family response regulator